MLKKSMLMVGAVALAALAGTGCQSKHSNDGAAMVPMSEVAMPRYVAKVEHKQKKVSGSADVHVLLGFISWGANGYADNTEMGSSSFFASLLPDTNAAAKKAAAYNACKQNKVDILIGTKYDMEITDYLVYKRVNCRVEGFPGIIRDVEQKGVTSKSSFENSGLLGKLTGQK